MKVHNPDLFVEVMQSADWSPSANIVPMSNSMLKLHEIQSQLAAQNSPHRGGRGTSKSRGGSPVKLAGTSDAEYRAMTTEQRLQATERALRQREAFVEKQKSRETEVRNRLEQSMKATQRAAADRAAVREKDFEARSAKFAAENSSIIRELEGVIRDDEIWKQRKKERLYQEWSDSVFQVIQSDIASKIDAMTHLDVASKRRQMFQSFLDESNRKKGGLFRDIIIESDYDPLTDQRAAAVKYKTVSHASDPCKNRFTRESVDGETAALVETMNTLSSNSGLATATSSGGMMAKSISREVALPVTMWDKIGVTVYGRYGDEPLTTIAKPNFNKSSVKVDHYDVPTGDAGKQLLSHEQNLKGKKVFPKLSESNVF